MSNKNSLRLTLHRRDPGKWLRLRLRPNRPVERTRPSVDAEGTSTQLATDGLQILKGVVPAALCDAVIRDYSAYERRLLEAGVTLIDPTARNYRLANFHLISARARDMATIPAIHQVLDEYFGRRSMVYTSLYFKHGSQQKTHIDTPFFVSNPVGWFAGVWIALEDVHPEAGPVQYFPGSHRLFDTREKLVELYRTLENPAANYDDFFDIVAARAATVSSPQVAMLKKGDILIWHHALPHGGQLAISPALTRHSMVFHMGSEGINLSPNGLFVEPKREKPKYGLFNHGGRAFARIGLPNVMI